MCVSWCARRTWFTLAERCAFYVVALLHETSLVEDLTTWRLSKKLNFNSTPLLSYLFIYFSIYLFGCIGSYLSHARSFIAVCDSLVVV